MKQDNKTKYENTTQFQVSEYLIFVKHRVVRFTVSLS